MRTAEPQRSLCCIHTLDWGYWGLVVGGRGGGGFGWYSRFNALHCVLWRRTSGLCVGVGHCVSGLLLGLGLGGGLQFRPQLPFIATTGPLRAVPYHCIGIVCSGCPNNNGGALWPMRPDRCPSPPEGGEGAFGALKRAHSNSTPSQSASKNKMQGTHIWPQRLHVVAPISPHDMADCPLF